MGKTDTIINFVGSVGSISSYQMAGVEKKIVRTKGGASKEKIKNSPSFERTRSNNDEFSGRSKATSGIRRAIHPVKHLADPYSGGLLMKVMTVIQKLDTESIEGQRNICLSSYKELLEGFVLNKNNPFDSVVRRPLQFSVNRQNCSAKVAIPILTPKINIINPGKHPIFRFIVSLGVVSDVMYNDKYGQSRRCTLRMEWRQLIGNLIGFPQMR